MACLFSVESKQSICLLQDQIMPLLVEIWKPRKTGFCTRNFISTRNTHDINGRDTSSGDCIQKHMLNIGAQPDQFRVMYCLLPLIFHGFIQQNRFFRATPFGFSYYLLSI